MGRTNDKISAQRLLDATLKKALSKVERSKELTKTTVDGVVQVLKLYKEYGGDEERIPKKLRVIWLDELKANNPAE